MKLKKLLFLITALLLVQSCATTTEKKELVIKRATYDLNCDKERLKVVDLDGNSYGVSGCGKKTTYIVDCPRGFHTCTAIMNGAKNSR